MEGPLNIERDVVKNGVRLDCVFEGYEYRPEREEVRSQRLAGFECSEIAENTGLSLEQVTDYCRELGLPETGSCQLQPPDGSGERRCPVCGRILVQRGNSGRRRFCSPACREEYYRQHTNSPLVVYTKLSPNHSGQRTHSIDRITPHCVVGQLSAESICGCFTSTSRQASCNYGIGTDGRVLLCVEEKNRSWCSSGNANDQRVVTIECASDMNEPYAMNSAVYDSLVKLCIDTLTCIRELRQLNPPVGVYYNIIDLARKYGRKVRYFAYASATKCAEQVVEQENEDK